ncbi:MAG: hypothetical protein WDO15_06585 [Bacteroidota bacterium]
MKNTDSKKLTKIDKDNHIYLGWFPKMSLARITDLGDVYYNSGFAAFAEPHVECKVTRSFSDPQYQDQWIMKNTGQFGGTPGVDIRIEQALDLIASSGIVPDRNICVAVLDEGVDIDHDDFVAISGLTTSLSLAMARIQGHRQETIMAPA